MKKSIAVVVALAAITWAFAGKQAPVRSPSLGLNLPTFGFRLPSLNQPMPDSAEDKELAWATWQAYLTAAREHDLPALRAHSYELSSACQDPARESECFSLMDSVVFFTGSYELGEFKHVLSDSRQVILHTDPSENTRFLYFVRDKKGALKVLGVRFCVDEESAEESCIEGNADTSDDDGDGWWESVESLFRS